VSKGFINSIIGRKGIEDLFIMPAIRKEGGTSFISTVLVGIDEKNKVNTDLAVEFCSPCPEDCPVNIDDVLKEL
jgi:hypothetical protein